MFLVSCTKSRIAGTPVKDGERDFIWSLIQIERFIYKISCVWHGKREMGLVCIFLYMHCLMGHNKMGFHLYICVCVCVCVCVCYNSKIFLIITAFDYCII